jgi:hypothetical protein
MCISPFACELRFQSRRQIVGRRSPSLLAAKIFDWRKERFRGNRQRYEERDFFIAGLWEAGQLLFIKISGDLGE